MKKEIRELVKSILREVFEKKPIVEQMLKFFLNDQVEIGVVEAIFNGKNPIEDGELYKLGDYDSGKGDFIIFFKTNNYECSIAGNFYATVTMTEKPEKEVGYRGESKIEIDADVNYFYSENLNPEMEDSDIQLEDDFKQKISPELIEALNKKVNDILKSHFT